MKVLEEHPAIRAARHALYDGLLAGGALQVIIAFGGVAHRAYDLWAAGESCLAGQVGAALQVGASRWSRPQGGKWSRCGSKGLGRSGDQAAKDCDCGSVATSRGPNFASYFSETDYARIPRWDLPAVAPAYVGDNYVGAVANHRTAQQTVVNVRHPTTW